MDAPPQREPCRVENSHAIDVFGGLGGGQGFLLRLVLENGHGLGDRSQVIYAAIAADIAQIRMRRQGVFIGPQLGIDNTVACQSGARLGG
jgi:hypothetical protein